MSAVSPFPAATAREWRRAMLWLLALTGVLFLVSFEQGVTTGGAPVLHELAHDARHLLGFPCH